MVTSLLILSCNQSINNEKSQVFFKSAYNKNINKDFIGALADYNKGIKLNPAFAKAYNNRGLVKEELKDYSGALLDYSKTIELIPNNSLAFHNRGRLKHILKDYNEAITDFNKAIELTPFMPQAYVDIAFSRLSLQDIDVAIIYFSKAIEQSWLQEDVKFLMKNGIPIPMFNDIEEQKQRLVECYYVRGVAYVQQQMQYEACRDFNELRTTLDTYSSAYLNPREKLFLQKQLKLCT